MTLRFPTAAAVLTDIEGTTTPIAFVKDVLFPYARARLPSFLTAHAGDSRVADILAAAASAAGRKDADPAALTDVFLRWMDEDAKIAPLKDLQGLIWREGYAAGEVRGEVHEDAADALRAWSARGLRLAVYSSGSVLAQKLLFAHTPAGDLAPLFAGFFDTAVGAKREPDSYRRIAAALEAPERDILFLSDVAAELDAAAAAGLATAQIVRPGDGTVAGARHPVAASFREIAVGVNGGRDAA